jgi:hypothetical protein
MPSFVLSQEGIFHRLNNNGFIELENKILLKTDFKTLYGNFDNFIEHMETDEQFSKNIDELEKKYVSNTELKKRYCSAPPSYRDPRKNTQKRFNKVYFQFMKEYHDMALDEHKEMFAEKKGAIDFLCSMKKLDDTAKVIFSTLIDQIEVENPGFKQLMYGKHKELTVISKIVRYNKTESWGTTPHRDKSALTLIWDSDDKNDESLSLCRNLHKPLLKNLEVPKRKFSGKDNCSSTLLIPGLSLQQSGINLPGTVHGVLPFTHEYRHAVISFLLIPDIDMSHIQSDFTE